MAKNMIRKGLAAVPAFALAISSLVASPAYAADNVTLAPDAGTTYATLVGDNFELSTSINPATQSNALKYKITNPDEVSLVVTWDSTSQAVAAGQDDISGGADEDASTAPNAGQGVEANGDFTSNAASFVATPTVSAGNIRDFVSTLSITAPSATTITVQAWLDTNGNGLVDDFDASPVRSVSYVKVADAVTSVSITDPVEGDTTASATFSFTNVNTEQIELTKVGIHFTQADGTALPQAGGQVVTVLSNTNPALTFPSTTKVFTATTGTLTALVKNTGSVRAIALFKAAGAPASTDTVGAATSKTVAARVIASITANVVDDTNSNVTGAGTGISRNDGTFTVKAVLKDANSKPVSGVAVTAKVEASVALAAAKTITVGGTKYTSSAALPGATGVAKVSAGTSDADGTVTLSLANAGFADTNTITVTFYVQNLSDAVVATLKDETYTGFVTNVNGGKAVTTDGSGVSLDVVVLDQFGGNAPAGYRARAVFDPNAGAYSAQATTASTAATGVDVPLTNGRATVTITDNGTGNGINTYDLGFNTGVAGAADTAIVADLEIHIKSAVQTVAGSFTLTDNNAPTALAQNAAGTAFVMTAGETGASNAKMPLQTADGNGDNVVFGNYDARFLTGSAPNVIANNAANKAELKGVVTSTFSDAVAAVALPNATVTISGAGLQFVSAENGSAVWGLGSLTVQADANGAYSFGVFSQTAGTNTVTITAGGVSKTIALIAADADDNAGATLTVTASDYVDAGTTVKVTIALVDRFGNPVPATDTADANDAAADFKVTWSGPGLVVGSLPDALGADGTAEINVLLGSRDSGSISVVASYDQDGDNNYTDTTDLSVTKVITIGTAPAADNTKVNAGSFKGYVAIYAKGHEGKRLSAKVGNDWVVVPALASNFVRVVEYTGAGYTIAVRIYIDRVLVDTITVTTK